MRLLNFLFILALLYSRCSLSAVQSKYFQWKKALNVHYIEAGCGSPLLLVPGFGVGTFHFDRNIELLSERFKVYSFDLVGQGKSWPQNKDDEDYEDGLCYSVDLWIEQILYFVENVIQGQTHLCGNSLGGFLCVACAQLRPDLIKSTVLLNPTPFWGFNSKARPFLWNGKLPAPPTLSNFGKTYFNVLRNPTTISSMLNAVYASKTAFDEALVSDIIESASHPCGGDAFTSILFAPKYDLDFDTMLDRVTCPVCLVYGREDPWIVPYWGQRAKRVKRSAVYFELSPTGHCPHHESPTAVNRILQTWIDAVEVEMDKMVEATPATATAPRGAGGDESYSSGVVEMMEVLERRVASAQGRVEEEPGRIVDVRIVDGSARLPTEHLLQLLESKK